MELIQTLLVKLFGYTAIKRFCVSIVCLLFVSACSTLTQEQSNDTMTTTDNISVTSSYLIGAEDVLMISVWKEPELNREVTVRPDGGISFPLAGDIDVQNKTVDQVREAVTDKIKKYIPKAEVTVSLVKASSYRIYVLGKVNKPGQYVLGSYVDVLQALSLANGLTPYASSDKIKILRRENGIERVYPFAYSMASSGERTDQNIMLRSGDVVLVP